MPLGIGLGSMVIGPQLQRPDLLLSAVISALILLAVCAILVLQHREVARKAQQRIEQLGLVSERAQAD